MLFERRAYTLRPGSKSAYWALQRKWNKPASFRPLLERNVGFFAMAAGDGERIVHLYRWDNFDDAKQRLGAIVTPDRMEYFIAARSSAFAPGPGQPAFANVGNASELAISESVLDFLPGGLLAYWDGFRKLNAATTDAFCTRLIGVFFVTVGSLHRVFAYHWHKSWPEAEAHRHQLAERPDWKAFMQDNSPRIVGGHAAHLRPSPLPWMRELFDPIDWTTI